MKRRSFIRSLLATGIIIQFPGWIACERHIDIKIPENEVLTPKQRSVVLFFLQKLFPADDKIPGIAELNTYTHLNNYLIDPNIDTDEKQYLINGIQWIEETAQETYKTYFNQLSIHEKNALFEKIMLESWGETWSSRLLNLIFESLLCDPLYDINLQKKGWVWLHHIPGKPRPTIQNSYQQLIKKKTKQEIITDLSQL